MSDQPIGIYAEQTAKRAALVSRLSPMARHQAFPRLYRRPAASATSYTITVDCKTGARTVAKTGPIVVAKPVPPPPKPRRLMSDAQIVEAARILVEEIWGIGRDELMRRSTRTRDGERYAVYRLLRQVYGWSLIKIGALVGRDHTSIMAGLKRAHDFYSKGEATWRDRFDEAAQRLAELKSGAEQ